MKHILSTLLLLALFLSPSTPLIQANAAASSKTATVMRACVPNHYRRLCGKLEMMKSGRYLRRFSVHLPPAAFPNKEQTSALLPLIIVLHGAKGSYKNPQGFTSFDKVADREGFITVYPDAVYRQWNDGRKKGDTPAFKVDDVAFLSELMTYMAKTYHADPERTFLVGFSSGGMMSQRFAMEHPEKVAAIVAVASGLPKPQYDKQLKPNLPMPVMMINGTADPAFPWAGAEHVVFAGIKVGTVMPVETTLTYWIDVNGGMKETPYIAPLPEVVMDGTHVERITHNTTAGVQVVLYKITGGGHSWPGAKYPVTYVPKLLLGKTSQQFDACEAIWEFLKPYSRDLTPQKSEALGNITTPH
jgi:polyhydroxybutyrate depolymerase